MYTRAEQTKPNQPANLNEGFTFWSTREQAASPGRAAARKTRGNPSLAANPVVFFFQGEAKTVLVVLSFSPQGY